MRSALALCWPTRPPHAQSVIAPAQPLRVLFLPEHRSHRQRKPSPAKSVRSIATKAGKTYTDQERQELQALYNEAKRRGLLKTDAKFRSLAQELIRRGVISDGVQVARQRRQADDPEAAAEAILASHWRDQRAKVDFTPSGFAELRPEEIVESYGSAVVRVEATFADGRRKFGTGFFISPNGVLATNTHVVDGAQHITLSLPSGEVHDKPILWWRDQENDLALLRVTGDSFPAVMLGDSEAAKIGSQVYVIGNPKGLENTIADGLLSGKREDQYGQKLLQISAPISPGSSGSPVFDNKGRVIGIAVSRLVGGENLNFAVPINDIHDRMWHARRWDEQEKTPRDPALLLPGKRILRSRQQDGIVECLSWHPNGRLLAWVETGTLHVWNAATGKEEASWEAAGGPGSALAWSSGGLYLAVTNGESVDIWNFGERRRIRELPGHATTALAWSANSAMLATASIDNKLRLWNWRAGRLEGELPCENGVPLLAWSPDGQHLACAHGHTTDVWYVLTRQREALLSFGTALVGSIRWRSDGKHLALGLYDHVTRRDSISIWETRSWNEAITLEGASNTLAWSPGGKWLISSGGRENALYLWDIWAKRLIRRFHGHTSFVKCIAWSPDGRLVATGSMDGMVWLWDLRGK